MPIKNLPAGLPKNVPAEFLKRLEKAEHPTKSADGSKLSKDEIEHVLAGLETAKPEVKKAAAAWLLDHSAEFGRFTLSSKAARETLSSFVEAQGQEIARASSGLATRVGSGAKPVKLDASTKAGIERGLELAVQRDEVSFRALRKPPSPDAYFTPPVTMKLDAGEGTRSYAVYVSKQVGIDMDTRTITDPKNAETFILFDVASNQATHAMNLARPMTGSALPGHGMRQPGEDMPALGGGGGNRSTALPSVVQHALSDHLTRAMRNDDAQWRAGGREPNASTHFLPAYTMKIRDPDAGGLIDVQVFFSKSPDPSFAAPPSSVEEAKKVTLKNAATGEMIHYSFGMPGRVTLPVLDG